MRVNRSMSQTAEIQQSAAPDLSSDTRGALEHLDRIARLMDSAITIPGTNLKIGADSIVGLVPGVGDTLALIPGLYIIGMGWRMGASKTTLGRMGVNAAIDSVVGSVPLLGDLFDAGFKSKLRNVALLRDDLTKKAATRAA
jgi:hypothetical protein